MNCNPNPDDFADAVHALRDALADMEAGDCGVPLDEFDREFRRRHGLPPSDQGAVSRIHFNGGSTSGST